MAQSKTELTIDGVRLWASLMEMDRTGATPRPRQARRLPHCQRRRGFRVHFISRAVLGHDVADLAQHRQAVVARA